MNGGSFRTWLPKLCSLGLARTLGTGPTGQVMLTDAGVREAGPAVGTGPAVGRELVAQWRQKLGGGGLLSMFDTVIASPEGIDRDQLAHALGMPDRTHGSFRTWLPKLNGLGLVRTEGSMVYPAESLVAG